MSKSQLKRDINRNGTVLKLRHWAAWFVFCVSIGLVSSGWFAFRASQFHELSLRAQQKQEYSKKIAASLEQEARQLSLLVRAYTATGEPKYKTYHQAILDIRDGSIPPPEKYSSIYWDQVIAGEIDFVIPTKAKGKSLLEKMKELGFQSDEMAVVRRIIEITKKQSMTEKIAFAAVEGRYNPAMEAFVSGGLPMLGFANRLINNSEYLALNSQIVMEISRLTTIAEKRTQYEISALTDELRNSIWMSIIALIITVIFIALISVTVVRRLLTPMEQLTGVAEKLGQGIYQTRTDIMDASIQEIGLLAASFNTMADNIEADFINQKLLQKSLKIATGKAEAAAHAKSDFLANMSHEIRTPMNAIIGMSHLAQRTSLTQKQRGYLLKIDNAAQNLMALINDILDFSKIEADKLEIETVNFPLEQVLENLADIVGGESGQKLLELVYDIAPDVPQYLKGDPLRLGQILINLVSNAIKFTEQGEIVVSAAVESRNGQNVRLRFAVRDTGVGMSPYTCSKLFKSFSQADTSITRQYGGTGLGLVICKKLIELMGGTINVESKPNVGSEFFFTVNMEALEQQSPVRARIAELAGKKVLVVDDCAVSRDVLSNMLQNSNFVTESAASAGAAILALERASAEMAPFDLILMDWRMPEMDGTKASRHIKANSRLCRIPAILMVTACSREEVMHQAMEAGIDGFLLKPVSETALHNAIVDILIGPSDSSESAMHTLQPSKAVVSLAGRRVLLVEDNVINRELAYELLTDMGIEVAEAVNGLEGVRRATTEKFDLVLIDLQMPIMDGLTATREIRRHPHTQTLPIIAMTAQAMSGDRERSLESGLNDHLTKPIVPQKLADTLARWLPIIPVSASTLQQPQSKSLAPLPLQSDQQSRQPEQPQTRPQPGLDAELLLLPEVLPPFDLHAALICCSNKPALLRKLLLSFGIEFPDADIRLRQMITDQNHDGAMLLAHSLKGAAATLGARDLADAAMAVERALRATSIVSIDPLLVRLGLELTLAVTASHSLQTTKPPQSVSPKVPTDPPSSDTLAALSEVRELIASNNIKARKQFMQLCPSLAGYLPDAEITAAMELLDKLNFPEAFSAIERIIEHMRRKVSHQAGK